MVGQKTAKSAKIFSLKNLGYTVLATYVPSYFEKMFSKILDFQNFRKPFENISLYGIFELCLNDYGMSGQAAGNHQIVIYV